eukprot:TRINITY_DN20487_c0_g1_i1.p1 TRINITY_DN20487_c0_g1~~TRINITY_DN20487_c0_g1_i1.p1  ORF type:complete len:430 (+),score=70.15 TRINITY_DN20487_c0_g1_i1:61-1350(+)
MLRREPLEIERSLRQLAEVCSDEMLMESHLRAGQKISSYEGAALLLDALLPGSPVIGASQGFEKLTGRSRASVLGQDWRAIMQGVHDSQLSRSVLQDVDNFLRMARMKTIDSMADCSVVLPGRDAEGNDFPCSSCFRLITSEEWLDVGTGKSDRHIFVLAVLANVDGFSAERRRDHFLNGNELSKLVEMICPHSKEVLCGQPAIFPAVLSSRCVLLNRSSTGMRREPQEVPRGCVLMSANSMGPFRQSYFFEIRVEQTLPEWKSRLPFLGFTCTSPMEVEAKKCFFGDLPHSFCLAESVMIGGTGEAWMRQQAEHLKPELGKKLEQSGAQRKHLTPDVPEYRRMAPLALKAGDLLGCRYQILDGGIEQGADRVSRSQLALYVNGSLAFQLELDGRLPLEKPLWAVVDVCYCVYQVTMMQPEAKELLMGG